MTEEDARTKQDLLFEVSSLNARLSNEIIKNEQLQNNWNELKKWLKEEHKININWYETLTPRDKGYYLFRFSVIGDVLDNVQDKMQELEGRSE